MGSDTWETVPSTIEGDGWKPDNDAGVAVGGWEPDTNGAADDGFSGEISPDNVSKHANGDFNADRGDNGCRICGSDQHFKRDCPDKPPNDGLCFNCGEEGHNKADCTNPRVEREFTGECRNCGETGHRKADCPSLPAQTCKICKQEGHIATECTANRMFNDATISRGIAEMAVEDAWAKVEAADDEKDVDMIKEAIINYAKAYPKLTFEELEEVFRESNMNTYLIAKKQQISATHTIVNLQGKNDQTYSISIQFSQQPRRAKFAEGWPKDADENMTRLPEAGFIMDRMEQQCSNCGQLGHGSRQCPEEKVEKEKPVITCANCGNTGHYARDCIEPRKSSKKGCRECGKEDHIAKDCANKVQTCRNCDAEDHISKDCPNPKDWSRVTCKRCGEKGHGVKKCPQPDPDESNDGDGGFGGGNDVGAEDSWGGGGDNSGW